MVRRFARVISRQHKIQRNCNADKMKEEIGCSVMCRACMKVDGVLLPMYGDNVITEKNLPAKLADLASIQVHKYDGLPSVLCMKCAYRTDAFHEFKLQVQETEKKLRKMFQYPIRQSKSPKAELVDKSSEEDDSVVEEVVYEPADVGESVTDDTVKEVDVKPQINEDCNSKNVIPTPYNYMAEEHLQNEVPSHSVCTNEHNYVTEGGKALKPPELMRALKNELLEEMSEILNGSETAEYTLLYISEDNSDFSVEYAGNVEILSKVEPSVEMMLDARSLEMNNIDDHQNSEIASKTIVHPVNESAIIPEVHESPKIESSRLNDDEESNDVGDTSKNLVGSLNDTITRIKEIRGKGEGTIFQCTLCVKNYDKLTDVLAHTVATHVPKDGPYFCVVCEKDCGSNKELRSHVQTHTGKYPYTCFVCNKAYSMKRYLKRHMSCHTDLPRHRCPKCGERFALRDELARHLDSHTYSSSPFACSQCPRLFNSKGNYKRHLIGHLDPNGLHLPKYPCDICGKRFLNNRTLQTHIRVHTGEKPFACEICGRTFSQSGNLLNHQRIHSNPRCYSCEVCGKRFNQRATLRDHGLLHTGEKPYVCNVCGVAFTFSAALRRHVWSHAEDKPFGCELCNARFVGQYDIKRHMKIHTERPKTVRRRNRQRTPRDEQRVDNSGPIARENCGLEVITNGHRDYANDTSVFADHGLLDEVSSQPIGQPRIEASDKENVDALLRLIEYG